MTNSPVKPTGFSFVTAAAAPAKPAEVSFPTTPTAPTRSAENQQAPIPCGARTVALHPHRGLMAISDTPHLVRIYKAEEKARIGKGGTNVAWHLADTRDLPTRTGIRSNVISMEFSPDGTQLRITTSGREALTTLEINPENGCVLSQTCQPPATFKV